jgi:hypothetical protein
MGMCGAAAEAAFESEMWDPIHAQNILMPCDNSTKLIRACYVGNWQEVGDILDEAEQELRKQNQAHKPEPNIYPTLPAQGLGSHDIDSDNLPSEANSLKGLKGAERLAAWKVIEEANELEDNRLHPEFLSAGDQVLISRCSKLSINVYLTVPPAHACFCCDLIALTRPPPPRARSTWSAATRPESSPLS